MSGDDDGGQSAVTGAVRTVVPDFVRRRFALKFVLVLLVMGVAVGAIGAAATAKITDQTRERIEAEYSGLANQERDLVSQWVDRNRLSTRHLSGDRALRGDNLTAMQLTLQDRLANDMAVDVSRAYVFNESDGAHRGDESGGTHHVLASNLPGPTRTLEGTNRDWIFDRSFESDDTVAVSSVYKPPGSNRNVIGFASPVDGTENRYLLVEVTLQDLASRFQGAERASGGFTQVVNRSGTVLIDERVANGTLDANADDVLSQYGDRQARKPIRKAFQLTDRPAGVITDMPASENVMDEEYAVGYAPVIVSGSTENWVVLVHGPASEVFGFVRAVSRWGLIATVAAVLLTGLIGAVLGYNTSAAIDRLTGKAEEMENGNLDVEVRSGRIDDVGRLYDGFAEMRDALKAQIEEAEQARKEAEVSRAEAMEMNDYLQDRAETYSEIMRACSRGDLTRRMDPDGENDAMDRIAEEFNDMIAELEMTTGQLKSFAQQVEEGGRSVQQSAETVRDASEQVADSVQKISDDAYDQKERLQAISEEMDAVADQLEAFAAERPNVDFGDSLDAIQRVAAMIDEAADLGEEAMAESENVAGAAEEQAAELNEVSARAEELVRYAQYLGDGLNNFETEAEHEFVFQTGAGSPQTGGDGSPDVRDE